MELTGSNVRQWCESEVFSHLRTLPVLSAARSIGSIFIVDLGQWEPDTHPNGEPCRRGEWSIFVEFCPWILLAHAEPVCTFDSEPAKIDETLIQLEGTRISQVGFIAPDDIDIFFAFDNGMRLELRTDDETLAGLQWVIFHHGESILSINLRRGLALGPEGPEEVFIEDRLVPNA